MSTGARYTYSETDDKCVVPCNFVLYRPTRDQLKCTEFAVLAAHQLRVVAGVVLITYSFTAQFFSQNETNCKQLFCITEWYLSTGLAFHAVGLRPIGVQKPILIDPYLLLSVITDNNQPEWCTHTYMLDAQLFVRPQRSPDTEPWQAKCDVTDNQGVKIILSLNHSRQAYYTRYLRWKSYSSG